MLTANSKPEKKYRISIPLSIRESKYFSFRDKRYPFDFDLFKKNSKFFFQNQDIYENVECIELFNEEESKKFHDIPDSAISNFISLSQNEECQINDSNIYYILYLSHKFDIPNLTKVILDIISENKKELILDSILFKIKEQNTNNYNSDIFLEDIKNIVSNMDNYIKDDKLLDFPVSLLHQILTEYFITFTNKKLDFNMEQEIIDFLFKCLDKKGTEASILFTINDFKEKREYLMTKLVPKYINVFDFTFLSNDSLKFLIKMPKSVENNEEDNKNNEENDDSDDDELDDNDDYFDYKNSSFKQRLKKKKEKVNIKPSTFTVPYNISSINENCFNVNNSFTHLVIPITVKSIQGNALYKCKYLKTVTMNPYIIQIVNDAFQRCCSLKHLIFEPSILEIKTICNFSHIKKITLPSTVK